MTAMVRAVRITNGQDHGQGRLYASLEKSDGGQGGASLAATDSTVPQQWTRVHFPLTLPRSADPAHRRQSQLTRRQITR